MSVRDQFLLTFELGIFSKHNPEFLWPIGKIFTPFTG